MKTQIRNIYSQTSSFYAFKPIFDLSLVFSPKRSIQLPHSLKSWLCGLLMKQSSFLLTNLKLRHQKKQKKSWIPSKRLEKRHLIYKHRLRLRDEFLLTHCCGEMFDLQHYFQSGGRVLYVSPEEKSKINGENVSHDSLFKAQSKSSNFSK